jgi:hypothetical protein
LIIDDFDIVDGRVEAFERRHGSNPSRPQERLPLTLLTDE